MVMVALPVVVVQQIVLFARDDTVSDAVKWQMEKAVVYPNITICNRKTFNKIALDSEIKRLDRVSANTRKQQLTFNFTKSTTPPHET